MIELRQILIVNSAHPRLSGVIADAVDFLKTANITRQSDLKDTGTAKDVGDLHAFRKRSGYYKEGAVLGLDETIESLASVKGNVRLGVIEADRGIVVIWIDEQDSIVGIFRMHTRGTEFS